MKKLMQALSLVLLSLLATLTIYWKIPVRGLIPFPGDLLVGRFFPFNTMEWEDYPTGVPYKEFINADVVRQLYPWRDLAVRQIKAGEIPWWNPYAFAGSPLLANVQSAPLYPLNILYFIFDHQRAWVVQVLLQPILAFIFIWLFTRELGLSRAASSLSSLAFAFGGYMVIWWQLNTVGHAALWLPLNLWGILRWRKTGKHRYLALLILGQTSSLLAGHIQTSLYVFIVSFVFFLFRSNSEIGWQKKTPRRWPYGLLRGEKLKQTPLYLAILVISLLLASPQLLPALRFIPLTPRGTQADEKIFAHFILPPKHLMTFFAHDYFGNPAVGNFWGVDYGEFMGFFGVVALAFALLAITSRNKQSEIKFFAGLGVVALIFALPPIAKILPILKIPILATSVPARTLVIVQFCGAVLAGFGLDYWRKREVQLKPTLLFIGIVYLLAWVVAGFNFWRSQDPTLAINWKVTLRNLIPPTAVFAITAAMLTIGKATTIANKLISYNLPAGKAGLKARKVSLVVIFFVTLIEYSYFANKFQTFSSPKFFFPDSPIYEFLGEHSQKTPDRFFGDYTASIMSNTWIPYRIFGVEGYDSLYITRFGELLAASAAGKIPESVPRSDANLIPNQDDTRRRRLQDLLGVRFILDKNDNPKSDWEPDPHRFPPERYQLIWQEGKFKVYENTQALPRAFFVKDYIVETDPQEIINKIFNQSFDLMTTLIVEEEIMNPHRRPSTQIQDVIDSPFSSEDQQPESRLEDNSQAKPGAVDFVSYKPNSIELKVETPISQLLFLSDAYYPDWVATIDGEETKIYRANYAFRAVVVPTGNHTVKFSYQPKLL